MAGKILYQSFEKFIEARLEYMEDLASTNLLSNTDSLHSYATKERSKVERMCNALEIPFGVFKPSSTYQMTRGCCELFACLLDWYESEYGRAIRKNLFTKVPKAFLIEVRGLLFDALRDAGIPNDRVLEEIHSFENYTGCPSRIITKALSEPVAEAIQICRDKINATDQEWDLIADCLELKYLSEFKPVLLKTLIEAVPEYFETKERLDQITEQVLSKHKNE